MHTPSQPSISSIQLYHQYIHPQQNNKQHKTTDKPSLRAIKPRQRPSRSSTNKQRTHPANHPSHQYNYITNTPIHNKTINNTKLPTSLAYRQLSHARCQAGRLLTNNAPSQPSISSIQLYHQYTHPQQNNKQHKTTDKPSLQAIKPCQMPSSSPTNKQRTQPTIHLINTTISPIHPSTTKQ